jgi:hypothetical protein
MKKVLTHGNSTVEVEKGTVGIWTDDKGFEWELFFEQDGDFLGVCVNSLDNKKLEQLEKDCENNQGFFDVLFEDTDIEQYSLKVEV